MYKEILESIGLTPNESKVYEAIIDLSKASIERIAISSKVHRRNVYDSIEKLVEKGLITREFAEGKKLYRAVNPTRLLDLIKEKETAINKILPSLQQRFKSTIYTEEAYIYKGIEGFKNYLQDILDVNETVYFIGAKGYWLDERLKYYLPKFDNERVKKGIHFKHIYDHEVRKDAKEILKLRLNEFRFLPKEFSSLTAVDIFGDYVVSFYGDKAGQLGEEPMQFVIKSRKIADGYRKFFDFMWQFCEK